MSAASPGRSRSAKRHSHIQPDTWPHVAARIPLNLGTVCFRMDIDTPWANTTQRPPLELQFLCIIDQSFLNKGDATNRQQPALWRLYR